MIDFLSSLGLITWDWDPALIRIGSFELRYYGILFALALALGYIILRWRYRDENEDPEKATNLTYALMIAIIVGTRLVHCLFYDFDRYMENPIEILYFWKGGLASHGAAIGIILTCVIYDYVWRKTPVRITVDRLAYGIPTAMICVRLGNFFNSEIVGAPCDPNSPLAFIFTRYDNVPRYPSQLFEVGMGIIAGAILFGTYFYYKKRNRKMPLGMSTALIITSYFTMRFIVEFFKEYQIVEDGVLQSSGLREGQILSIPFIAIGIVLLAMCIWGPWKNQYAEQFTARFQVKKPESLPKNNENTQSENSDKSKDKTE
ncbi:MAG: prolipoprotein diacylglyceryl transferase [Proteobacteria bacterium]|nr:prolipoprotein diacylglyceryl transferase [Pseudomonadota bacterium]